jgi:VanZ family protein
VKGLFYAYAGAVYLLCVIKLSGVSAPGGDKVHHFFAFALFAALFSFAYKKSSIVTVLIVSVIFGYFIEVSQYFLPYRTYEIMDVLADFSGAVFGAVAVKVFLKVLSAEKKTALPS